MALQRVETDAIQDDAITTAKIAANAVAAADIAADAITNVKVASNAAIAVSKITGLGTAATLTAGTAANNVVQLDGSGRLPAISGANLTGVSTDTSAMENNIAILAFKTQSANNLAKFNLVDQVIDEYKDGTGATYSTAGQTGATAADGYLSSSTTAGTATSTANTALTAPTTGDIVLLIEEVNAVTTTLNTAGNDLRCAISRNGGTGWDYVTLVDKGSWGTNKKILVANNVAFSNSASGTDMRYKIEWANQVAPTVITTIAVPANTKYLFKCDGADNSTNVTDTKGHTATVVGNTHHDTTIKKFGLSSLEFDNANGYVTYPASIDHTFGSGEFYIGGWVYPTLTKGHNGIISNRVGTLSDQAWDLRIDGSNILHFDNNDSTPWNIVNSGSTTVPLNTWTHVAVSRNSSNAINLFIGGVVVGTNASWTNNYVDQHILNFGRDGHGDFFVGHLDEFIIIKGSGGHVTAFTPQTAEYYPSALTGSDGHQVKVHATSLAWA